MGGVLKKYRVLDLSDERGQLCGQILGDLGADVIQIEPPGGSRARQLGPYAGDTGDPNDSLTYWGLNRNKRSVVLDVAQPNDLDALHDLVRSADFLIESGEPGELDDLGLGYEELSRLNPGMIYASITAFGGAGPKHRYASTDLIALAASGSLALNGDHDRAPLRLALPPQGFLHASVDATIGVLAAHEERLRSGRGQRVVASAQLAGALATQYSLISAAVKATPTSRLSGGVRIGDIRIRMFFPAKDGYVSLSFFSGSAIGVFSRSFMHYAHANGFCDEATRDIEWLRYWEMVASGAIDSAERDRIEGIIASFIASKTKAEWMEIAISERLLIVPVATTPDLVENRHFNERGYWADIHHPSLGRDVRYPGPFARFSDSPIEYRRPAPKIGEHGSEILAQRPEPRSYTGDGPLGNPADGPLAGLKILDFMWVMAGPAGTRTLTDLGAQVIRVESPTRIDTARTLAPFANNEFTADASGVFSNCNAGKLGIALDLSNPASHAVVHDLLQWADVVTESFSPKAMRAFGLAYDDLVKLKPDLIMLSSCLMGQTGPQSKLMGYGTMGAALAGFQASTGWPDRDPAGLFGAYTDYVACRFTAIALLAALEHRRQTGRGQYIDQSQIESTSHFLTPAILEYTVNGRDSGAMGNADPHMAPHGVYRAAGDDEWVAIACRNEADWHELCRAIEQPELINDTRFSNLEGRQENREALEQLISDWTSKRKPIEIEHTLQARNVPAHPVNDSAGFCADAQVEHQGYLVEVEHPSEGTMVLEGPRFNLSRTPASVRGPAPTLGQHTNDVLQGILGYDAERIAELAIAGALG